MNNKTVTMAHGAGGKQTSELIDEVFKAHFSNPDLRADDAAVLPAPKGKIAMSTDGFIVSPAFFPGGNIGKLSICGTVNDLACMGAKPLYLSCAFVIEEGFPMEKLEEIAGAMEKTAKELLTALAVALVKFQEGKPFFVNAYPRVVTREGSREAQKLVADMMENCDTEWRGLGIIPNSGLRLKKEWEAYDARKKFHVPEMKGRSNPACRCGDVLQGKCKPSDCKVFGKGCTPQHPIGACMVSNEGACSAYYQYS